jgi:diguanylate cyclase (GGDEF)-like protein/PAS domain S-box-containing protein
MKKPADHSHKHPLRLKLTLAAALAALILGWLSWDAYHEYRYAATQLATIGRMEMVRAKIVHLDEVLTMSARMAAASGNLDWETRYLRFEPQLDQAIQEALRLEPNASQGAAAAKTEAANVVLVAMEHRAFELVRQGKNAEAQRLLSSGEYENQKKIYAASMTEFNRHLLQAGDSMREELHSDMRRSAITTIASAMLLILGAVLAFRVTHRWQAVILESNWQLNHKSAELVELNNQLDRKVSERTHELVQTGERLQASEAQYRLLFDNNPHPMWVFDMETLRFLTVNGAAVKHYGYSEQQFLAMSIRDIRPVEDVASMENVVDELRGQGKIFGVLRHRTRDGSLIDVEISSDRIVFNGRSAGLVLAHDVTKVKRAEISIKRLNRVYAVLSGINTLIVRVRNRDELFKEACRIAVKVGGFRMAMLSLVDPGVTKVVPVASAGVEDELLTAIKARLSSSEDAPSTMISQAIRGKKPVISNDSQNDSRVLFGKKYAESGVRSMAILPLIVANEGVGVLALYAAETGFFDEEEIKLLTELAGDISFAVDHIDKQERLDYVAYYDTLTGLANRALFHERLEQRVMNTGEPSHKLALVLLDIERYKTINDTLGRQAGDALLKDVAVRLSAYAADVGRLARIDADHFALMVPDVQSGEELARLTEQLVREVFGPPFRIGDSDLRVSAKFGIAIFPADGADADTLFRNAEAALKKAKASGERYLFYTQRMNERVAEKLSLENKLRQALDNEEFVLHYQPKVNLLTRKVTSAEALIRWNDPRTGLVPPGRFIPILEETGLIYEVGRWALRKAIEDYLRWRAAGLAAVRLAVNVSALQMRNRGFIGEVTRAIGIDAHAAAGLELEITESLIMEDVKHGIANLEAIRAMGVSIAIDDFGTGFSSLSYLSKLPLDTLKIDRSFVINMTSGPQGMALVSSIINLAHSLKLKVVAEGVETEEQSRLLQMLTCEEMQGYLFSKPLPAEIFETSFLTPRSASDDGADGISARPPSVNWLRTIDTAR